MNLQAAETAVQEEPIIPEGKREEPRDTNLKIAEEQKDRCQDSVHGSFQGLLAKFRQELEELEETGVLSHEETEEIRNMGKESHMETAAKGEFPQKAVPSVSEGGLFPFEDGRPWKRLSLEEMTLLSQVPLKWRKEFFFLLPYRKYHHLILRENENGVWLGLPGQFNTADAADAHAFGFHEFRNIDGNWGYWMTFLERNS